MDLQNGGTQAAEITALSNPGNRDGRNGDGQDLGRNAGVFLLQHEDAGLIQARPGERDTLQPRKLRFQIIRGPKRDPFQSGNA